MQKLLKQLKIRIKYSKKLIGIIWLVANFQFVKSQTFTDMAPMQNIMESYANLDDYTGGGLSFYDFDDDGWDDLTFVHFNDSLSFYKNNQGIFEQLPLAIYDTGMAKHAVWVDYDNDSLNDLFVTFLDGPIKLYKNLGNLSFTDFTQQAGLNTSIGANHSIAFGDYDKDGFLDLFIGRYSYSSDTTLASEKNALLKNNGDGTFTDVTQNSGIDAGINQTLATIWLDYNKDGWPDIYVVTDRYHINNNLLKNNGDGTFTDVAANTGSLALNTHGMTNTVGDFDNDGDLDIYITNLGGLDTCRFLINNNNSNFTESAMIYGVDNLQATWGSSWIDADNDGYLDLIVVSQIGSLDSRNYLYMSNNGLSFTDSPQNFQSNAIADSRAIANGDINNDGRTDCVVLNTFGYQSFIWQNTGTNGNFVKITLQGTISNKMAIGSWIEVYANGQCYSRYTFCGENYLGQNSQHYIFGLGQASIIDSVLINYLSGISDKYYNLGVNQSYDFTEGETLINQIVYSGALSFCNGDSVILDAGIYDSYLWNTGSNQRFLTVGSSGIYWVNVTNAQGLLIASDSIVVFAANQPQISINSSNISCFNQNDGQVILELVNQTNNYTILWNGGLSGDTISNLSEGMYTYQYSDVYGCTAQDSIYIEEPFDFNIQTLITDFTVNNLGSIQTTINGGTPPYTIYFNGNVSGNIIDSLQPGLYYFEVVDANLCSHIENFEILFITSESSLNETPFLEIYPNPLNTNIFSISSNLRLEHIQIFNGIGQCIEFVKNGDQIQIIDPNVKGMLYLIVEYNNEVKCFKLTRL
jgi:hypothetical protein